MGTAEIPQRKGLWGDAAGVWVRHRQTSCPLLAEKFHFYLCHNEIPHHISFEGSVAIKKQVWRAREVHGALVFHLFFLEQRTRSSKARGVFLGLPHSSLSRSVLMSQLEGKLPISPSSQGYWEAYLCGLTMLSLYGL